MSQQAILRREKRDGRIVRVLECGHVQPEVGGGKSTAAAFALCKTCEPQEQAQRLKGLPAPADSTCTAFVVPLNERRIRLCGEPAPVLNARGAPRCRRHVNKRTAPQ